MVKNGASVEAVDGTLSTSAWLFCQASYMPVISNLGVWLASCHQLTVPCIQQWNILTCAIELLGRSISTSCARMQLFARIRVSPILHTISSTLPVYLCYRKRHLFYIYFLYLSITQVSTAAVYLESLAAAFPSCDGFSLSLTLPLIQRISTELWRMDAT